MIFEETICVMAVDKDADSLEGEDKLEENGSIKAVNFD